MHRVPLTLRALLLVPLLAVAVDEAPARLACGPRPARCPAAAGQSWLGAAGIALLMIYALAGAVCVARLARRPSPMAQPASLARLWLLGSARGAALCGR